MHEAIGIWARRTKAQGFEKLPIIMAADVARFGGDQTAVKSGALCATGSTNGSVEIPDDPELEVDLTGPEYGFSSKNQIQFERKEDMKPVDWLRLTLGDCLAMTFAVDIALRSQRPSKLVYHFSRPNAWMGY